MIRFLISGGGTGGHVFPAIAIANAIRETIPDAGILFVGAKGKMEMEKVPAAGYRIAGLTIAGFQRRFTWKNFIFPFKLAASLVQARRIIKKFKPDVIIGVGGYASGPVLRTGVSLGIPALIQEQNSYPGVTNRILSGKVQKICVAYSGMEKYFPGDKIIYTGNPVRQDLLNLDARRAEALAYFSLSADKMTVLVLGGSLGAVTINRSVMRCLESGEAGENIQWLWQCGKFYAKKLNKEILENPDIAAGRNRGNIFLHAFIDRMDLAYSAADVVISRAGAIAISELCIAGKPVILIPSPNVAEDHQTKNAVSLATKNAALMITDGEAVLKLGTVLNNLLADKNLQESLKNNILGIGVADASRRIAAEALKLVRKNKTELPDKINF